MLKQGKFKATRQMLTAIGICTLIFFSSVGHSQSWPDKTIKLIIPFAPGGTTDILGRILAQQMGVILGQNINVENRAGAGGNIGAEVVANAPPNGYTLLLVSGSMMTVNPFLYKKLPINYAQDLTYLTAVAGGPMLPRPTPGPDR